MYTCLPPELREGSSDHQKLVWFTCSNKFRVKLLKGMYREKFLKPQCIHENHKSVPRTGIYCIFPMCLSTGLFFGPVSPGARALEALKLQPKECSSLFLELSPRAHSQACPVTTQPSCRSLNIIFLQKVFNRTATVTTLQIPGDGYLYLFVLLNFILPL